MAKLALICAMSHNRAIGRDNQLPWHLPADLQFFKRTTLGKPIIMGRKTYESIGRPLPGRTNIVVTRQAGFQADGIHVATSLSEAITIAQQYAEGVAEEFFVIGGAELYAQALPLADRLYLTHVEADIEGDAYFPLLHNNEWQLISAEAHPVDALNHLPITFKVFEPLRN